VIAKGVKAVAESIKPGTPGGLAFATPNGATLAGALEAVPAIAVEGTGVGAAPAMAGVGIAEGIFVEGIGAGTVITAAGGLPSNDFTSLSFARKADGKDPTSKVGKTSPVDRPASIERKIDTPEIRNSFWDQLKQSGEWENVSKYDKPTLRHKETGRLIQKSIEKWEIEVFNKNEEHIGVIKPSDGILRKELAVKGRTMKK
jgi:hypothetical protein